MENLWGRKISMVIFLLSFFSLRYKHDTFKLCKTIHFVLWDTSAPSSAGYTFWIQKLLNESYLTAINGRHTLDKKQKLLLACSCDFPNC